MLLNTEISGLRAVRGRCIIKSEVKQTAYKI